MTIDKAYELLQQSIKQNGYDGWGEMEETSSMALEVLYEKAKDYDNMLVVAMEQQVARKELEELTF